MVSGQSACLRRLARGRRSGIVGFGRFLANGRVTVESLIEGWGETTSKACAGLHVLAIQDTSELNFSTTRQTRRGLGKIGKGGGHGLLLHAMLGVDADTGGLLGLVAGQVWTRSGPAKVHYQKRALADRESQRWLSTGEAAKPVLAQAAMVTEVSDRESDLYARWARTPEPGFHVLTRAMGDRRIEEGGKTLSSAPLTSAGMALVEAVRERPGRAERQAHLLVRFGQVTLERPYSRNEPGLPRTIAVNLVEVTELDPPAGVEPILWRLLTTHLVADTAMAWRVVGHH